jgi:hypothetical protein
MKWIVRYLQEDNGPTMPSEKQGPASLYNHRLDNMKDNLVGPLIL